MPLRVYIWDSVGQYPHWRFKALQPETHASPRWRQLPLAAAALFLVGAGWRTVIAVRHFYRSLAIADDPSLRELEQVSAWFEGVLAMVLVAHAAALFWLSRNPFTFRWPLAFGVALICASFLGGALLKFSVLAVPGTYGIAIVIAVAILSHVARFDWLSLYFGALVGSAIAWYGTAPTLNTFVGLFVAGPCVVYALVGAVVERLGTKAVRRYLTKYRAGRNG